MVKNGVTMRIQNISNKEMRDLNPLIITRLLETLEIYVIRRNNYRVIEELELIFAKKLLLCTKIEHKLKGLEELNKSIKKVEYTYGKLPPFDKSEPDKKVHWLTYDYLVNWIIDNEIFDVIFIDSVHPEMISRSNRVVSILAKNDRLILEDLEIIWNNTQEVHEDTRRATLDMIHEISVIFSRTSLQFIFKKINEIDNSNYDVTLIKFLEKYIISAMGNSHFQNLNSTGNIFKDSINWIQNKKGNKGAQKFFNLDKFWDIANDENVTDTEIKQSAMDSLISIFDSVPCPINYKIQYLNLSVNNIISEDNFVENIVIFQKILSKFRHYYTEDIEQLTKIDNSVGGFISMVIYKLQEVVSSQIQKNLIRIALNGQVDITYTKDKETIIKEYKELYSLSLEIIEYIMSISSEFILTNKEIDMLHELYVKNYEFSEHGQDLLYTLFTKKAKFNRELLTEKNKRFLFDNILCSNTKVNHSQMTSKAFHCFVFLFLSTNSSEGVLVYNKTTMNTLFLPQSEFDNGNEKILSVKNNIGKVITEVHSFAILGLETVWRILCSTQYEDLLDQGRIFLISIYLKLNVPHFNDQLIFETFFEKIFLMMSLEGNSKSN